MGREMTKGEISIIAADCIKGIRANEDPVELLKAKGFDEPVKTWYDIRRWIKSNRAADYAMIPAKWRIEIPEKPTEKVTMEGKHGERTFKLYGDKPAEEAPRENENTEKLDEVPKDEISGFEPVDVKKKRGGWPKGRPRKKSEDPVEKTKEEPEVKRNPAKLRVMEIVSESFEFRYNGLVTIKLNENEMGFMTITEEEAEELVQALPEAIRILKS